MSRGMRAMIESALAFSVMSVCVKLLAGRLPVQELVLARGVITLILSVWAVRGLKEKKWGTRKGLLILRGAIGFLGLNAYYYSLAYLPLADATVIQYMNPLLTALLSSVFLGERVRKHEIIATAIALVGVVLVARPSFLFGALAPLPFKGVLIAVAGAVCSALAYVCVRALGRTETPAVIVFYFPLVAVPLTVPFAASQLVWPAATDWIFLVLLGVFTQVGQQRMTVGLQLERAGPATAMTYLQIVFAFVWGLAIFHETPSLPTIAGASCIVAGALYLTRRPISS